MSSGPPVQVQPTWDAKTRHLMSTSTKVQAYLGARNATHIPKPATKRGSHDTGRPTKRRCIASPQAAYPTIFAKSRVLAARFHALVD